MSSFDARRCLAFTVMDVEHRDFPVGAGLGTIGFFLFYPSTELGLCACRTLLYSHDFALTCYFFLFLSFAFRHGLTCHALASNLLITLIF